MPGVRVTHPALRNVRCTVVEANTPYTVPFQCTTPQMGGCGSLHLFKTHHLNIDETGSVIISTGVWERIKSRLILDGFVIANEVQKPPPIILNGKPFAGEVPIVASPSNMEGH